MLIAAAVDRHRARISLNIGGVGLLLHTCHQLLLPLMPVRALHSCARRPLVGSILHLLPSARAISRRQKRKLLSQNLLPSIPAPNSCPTVPFQWHVPKGFPSGSAQAFDPAQAGGPFLRTITVGHARGEALFASPCTQPTHGSPFKCPTPSTFCQRGNPGCFPSCRTCKQTPLEGSVQQ